MSYAGKGLVAQSVIRVARKSVNENYDCCMFFVGIGVHLHTHPAPAPTLPQKTGFGKVENQCIYPVTRRTISPSASTIIWEGIKWQRFITPVTLCLKWPGWTANLVNGAVNHAHGVGEVWKCVQELARSSSRVPFYIILIIHKKNRYNMVNLFCHGAFRNTEIMCQNMEF